MNNYTEREREGERGVERKRREGGRGEGSTREEAAGERGY